MPVHTEDDIDMPIGDEIDSENLSVDTTENIPLEKVEIPNVRILAVVNSVRQIQTKT
jgi:hypothetical protein